MVRMGCEEGEGEHRPRGLIVTVPRGGWREDEEREMIVDGGGERGEERGRGFSPQIGMKEWTPHQELPLTPAHLDNMGEGMIRDVQGGTIRCDEGGF